MRESRGLSPLHTQDTSQAGVLKHVLSESLVETQRTSEEDVTFYWVLRPWGFMSKPSSSSKVLRVVSMEY